jgi:hemerythrin-like domain-containing protein
MECSELLSREHEVVHRAIRVLEMMMADDECGPSIDKHDVNALLIFLHYFVDTYHQAKEEGILFPVLKGSQTSGQTGTARDQLEKLLAEHHEERSLIEKTQLALFSMKRSEFIENAEKLVHALRKHILMEEQLLFPLADKILTEREDMEALTQFEQADAKFGDSQRTLLIELLQELEAKYLLE